MLATEIAEAAQKGHLRELYIIIKLSESLGNYRETSKG